MNSPTDKVTTMAELRKPLAPEQNMPAVRLGFDNLQGFTLMQRVGTALAASTLVPPDYRGNLPNCLIALEMASRIGASPLMVMQNLYIVHGKPGWSGQFLIASFNQCGRFTAMRFEWQGEQGKDSWGCRAWAIEKSTEQRIQGPLVTIAMAKAEGWYGKKDSKWQTIPELMLMYRAAAWLVRTHAPEISMGLQTAEELSDTFDAEPTGNSSYAVQSVRDLKPANGNETKQVPSAQASPPAPPLADTGAPQQPAGAAPAVVEDDAFRLKLAEWIDYVSQGASEDEIATMAEDVPQKFRDHPDFAKALSERVKALPQKRR